MIKEKADIRNIPIEQFTESMELSSFAFQYELSPEDQERRRATYREHEQWGAYIDGKLAAKLRINDFETWIQGKRFAVGGIASVATWPEHRRRGLVTQLLHHALRVMKDRGQTLSFLHPFQFGFYRRFGWEMHSEYKAYELPVSFLPRFSSSPGRIERGRFDGRKLEEIYTAYASRFNGMLVRDEAWWEYTISFRNKSAMSAVYYDAQGVPAGYVLYQVKDQIMKVHELVFLHHEARTALWRFLADHDSMLDRVTLTAPLNDELHFLVDNPRFKQELIPYGMARIVDVKTFLSKYAFASGLDTALLLSVEDEHAPWNHGTFRLQVDESGSAAVSETDSEIPGLETISCSIQTLTALMMGYKRPGALLGIGRLQASDGAIELLERLIPPSETYLMDFF